LKTLAMTATLFKHKYPLFSVQALNGLTFEAKSIIRIFIANIANLFLIHEILTFVLDTIKKKRIWPRRRDARFCASTIVAMLRNPVSYSHRWVSFFQKINVNNQHYIKYDNCTMLQHNVKKLLRTHSKIILPCWIVAVLSLTL
jgi:hypothetical protein